MLLQPCHATLPHSPGTPLASTPRIAKPIRTGLNGTQYLPSPVCMSRAIARAIQRHTAVHTHTGVYAPLLERSWDTKSWRRGLLLMKMEIGMVWRSTGRGHGLISGIVLIGVGLGRLLATRSCKEGLRGMIARWSGRQRWILHRV
jgi:hypothetical protein